MEYKKKGEIAVFLAMILSVMCMFILTLIDNAKTYLVNTRILLASDAAVRSVFAEYNKRLYEQFGIMCIDPSYKTDESGLDMLNDHLITYINENIRTGGDDFDDLYVSEIYLTQVDLISENKAYFEEAIRSNLKGRESLTDYVLRSFGNSIRERENAGLKGELEYLIYGYDNDNLNMECARADYEDYINLNNNENNDYEAVYISGNGKVSRKKKEAAGGVEAVSYEEYLQMQIEKMTEKELLDGIKELITMDIRNNGSPSFDLDNCIVGLEYAADISSSAGKNYSILGSYEY